MWKLIDCGSYPWFVKATPKYYHCVYSSNGEYKKLYVNRENFVSRMDKMRSHNLKTWLKAWSLDDVKCIIDKKTYNFCYKHWKGLNKTKLMKEILKQLKDSRVASS